MRNGSGRIIAIGDVHGCALALDALLDVIQPTQQDQLVFLGDVVDMGRETRDVLDRMIELESRCHLVLIRGNHEEMMFAAHESEKALRYWEVCGGLATLTSYRYGAGLRDIPQKHWDLLAEARDYYETDEWIFTHANYLPDLPMGLQPEYQLRWALFEPDEMHPHCSGKSVVVGHTEQRNSEVLDLGFVVCIDTACWRHGWLTAFDVGTRQVWQASRWGLLREAGEPTHRERLPRVEHGALAAQ